MTVEKARKILFEIADQCAETANILCTEDADERCEAIDMAIEVLGKQITMEPVKSKTPRYGMGYVYHDWECPSCGCFIAFETDINGLQKKHHCNKCGQALKKEEE